MYNRRPRTRLRLIAGFLSISRCLSLVLLLSCVFLPFVATFSERRQALQLHDDGGGYMSIFMFPRARIYMLALLGVAVLMAHPSDSDKRTAGFFSNHRARGLWLGTGSSSSAVAAASQSHSHPSQSSCRPSCKGRYFCHGGVGMALKLKSPGLISVSPNRVRNSRLFAAATSSDDDDGDEEDTEEGVACDPHVYVPVHVPVDRDVLEKLAHPQVESFRAISELVQRRSDARKLRDFDLADRLLVELQQMHNVEESESDPVDHLYREGVREVADMAGEEYGLGPSSSASSSATFRDDNPAGEDPEGLRRLLKPGYRLEVKDLPLSQGGGTIWNAVPIFPLVVPEDIRSATAAQARDVDTTSACEPIGGEWQVEYHFGNTNTTVMQIAHAALGLATDSASRNTPPMKDQLEYLVRKAENRIVVTQGTDLYGRSAADAAFWFALAGVKSTRIYEYLVSIATNELRRYGRRPSCRPKCILHVVERMAAAGLRGHVVKELHEVAADCLRFKGFDQQSEVVEALSSGSYALHAVRPLLLIWKFSTKQRKQRAFLDSAAQHWNRVSTADKEMPHMTDETPRAIRGENARSCAGAQEDTSMCDTGEDGFWSNAFDDPTRPLVVDIGCGMGVSLLGLSTLETGQVESDASSCEVGAFPAQINWSECNFLGTDLSQLAIGYASGVASRFGVTGRQLKFCKSAAEECLERIRETYPGKVKLIMIQFPTPFRLAQVDNHRIGRDGAVPSKLRDDADDVGQEKLGNSQLPSTAHCGFMVTSQLLRAASTILEKGDGHLLLQSNCEDVAVRMRNMAVHEAGFECLAVPNPVEDANALGERTPQRTSTWVDMGGERAEGSGWSVVPLLPKQGATETEVACGLNGTPVHRCVLVASKK